MSQQRSVENFVADVRRRLNRQLWWQSLRWSLLIGGVTMLLIALGYVWQGYQVPPVWYPAMLGLTLAGAAVLWWCRRWSSEQAEVYADKFFGLPDAVSSQRGFQREGRQGAFYDLHTGQVERWIEKLDPHRIRPDPARRMTATIGLIIAVGAALGFKGSSDEVRQLQERAEQVRDQTDQINRELKNHVEELAESAEDEAELIDANRLREWVEELAQHDDKKEALRQYARFQQRLRRQSARFRHERDEALLEKAARYLQDQGASRESRELGRKLKRKQYDEAAEELAQNKPGDLDDVEQERVKLDRLQAAAERMAQAAREFRRRRGSGGGDAGGVQSGRSQPREGLEEADSFSQADEMTEVAHEPKELDELLEVFERQLDEYDEALGQCQSSGRPGDEDADLLRLAQEQGNEAGQCLVSLTDRLQSLDAAQRVRQRLAQLRRAVGQAQSRLVSGVARADNARPDGQRAGVGTDDNPMDNEQETPDAGRLARIKGQKGTGPSLTTVEEADSGSGVSRRGGGGGQFEFQQEVESFVEREEVPEALRDGVKQYFERIHQYPELREQKAGYDTDN